MVGGLGLRGWVMVWPSVWVRVTVGVMVGVRISRPMVLRAGKFGIRVRITVRVRLELSFYIQYG